MSFYTSTSKSKYFLNIYLYSLIVILFLILCFNVAVNPYGNAVIKITGFTNKNIAELSSFQKLDVLDDIKFDSFTIGSSQVSRFYAQDLEQATGSKWISFPIGTSMASEHFYYINYLNSHSKIKNIIYMIDDGNLFGKYVMRGNTIKTQVEEYIFWDYLSIDTIKKSIDKLIFNIKHKDQKQTQDIKEQHFNGWKDKILTKESLDNQMSIKPTYTRQLSKREVVYLRKIQQENSKKIIPIFAFYHPYITLMNQKDNYYKYLKMSIEIFGSVWHINPKYMPQTLDASLYFNATHTNRKFAKRVINSIFNNDDFFIKINASSFEEVVDEMFNSACRFNFEHYTYSKFLKCN